MNLALLSSGLLNHFCGWNVGSEQGGFICCLGDRSKEFVVISYCNSACTNLQKSKGISRGQEKGTLVFFSHLAHHIHSSLLVTIQHMLARLFLIPATSCPS